MENTRVLIVDDDPNINQLIKLYLEKEGFETETATRGDDALNLFKKNPPHIVLLDLMLPGMDGWQVCREIRKISTIPIIMLTAKDETFDKVLGLELGADDYVTKPFSPLELVARVKTQLRRYLRYNGGEGAAPEDDEIDIRGLSISQARHRCTLNGQELKLTPLEFRILWTLCRRRGSVVSSEELFESAWGEKYLDNNNTVMAHIARLREKMHEPARRPKFIKTVWGVGYTIEP